MLGEQSRYQALERESMKMAAQSDRLRQGRVELMEQWNQAEEERKRREEEWEDEKVSTRRERVLGWVGLSTIEDPGLWTHLNESPLSSLDYSSF